MLGVDKSVSAIDWEYDAAKTEEFEEIMAEERAQIRDMNSPNPSIRRRAHKEDGPSPSPLKLPWDEFQALQRQMSEYLAQQKADSTSN